MPEIALAQKRIICKVRTPTNNRLQLNGKCAGLHALYHQPENGFFCCTNDRDGKLHYSRDGSRGSQISLSPSLPRSISLWGGESTLICERSMDKLIATKIILQKKDDTGKCRNEEDRYTYNTMILHKSILIEDIEGSRHNG
ncbi:hypothetical protein HPL003_26970 [Paenibacillus terrae HPL-003]|uniref:Uncharacterized protein n=1 Tax=Paenibacillus terrae (strain HPL-003) TaxID=985665 RepID=G7VRT7_PAETH|nr:hypothetical protein HPL003_26970 [Paenibacillus terrae HPL-003]